MNFVETVEKAIEKRNRILNAKKEELLLLENRKTSIDEELKEAKNNYFLYADDEGKVKAYEDKEKELADINEKIIKLKSQISLLQANFYVDYDMADISKELKKVISDSGLNKDLEKVDKKINELKELAKEIEVKRDNITTEFAKYMQDTIYLPSDKKELLTEDEVEILTTLQVLANFKDAIPEALYKGVQRNIVSEESKKTQWASKR